jgi:hypothetical protein
MLLYLFYVLPFFCLAAYALTVPGCSWLPDWALVFAGAIGQVRGQTSVCVPRSSTPRIAYSGRQSQAQPAQTPPPKTGERRKDRG